MSRDSQSTKEARCEISLTKLLIPEVVRTLMARGVVDSSRSTGGYLAYAVGLHGHQNSFRKILHGFRYGGHCQWSESTSSRTPISSFAARLTVLS